MHLALALAAVAALHFHLAALAIADHAQALGLPPLPFIPVFGDVVTNGFDKIKGDAGPILLASAAIAGAVGYFMHAAGYTHASNHLRTAFIGAGAGSILVYGGDFLVHLFA